MSQRKKMTAVGLTLFSKGGRPSKKHLGGTKPESNGTPLTKMALQRRGFEKVARGSGEKGGSKLERGKSGGFFEGRTLSQKENRSAAREPKSDERAENRCETVSLRK